MCREQMLKFISDAAESADDRTLEQLYWLILMETTG